MIKYILSILITFSPTVFADLNKRDVNEFVEYMFNEHSYDKAELNILFDNVKPESRIKKYFKKAPERTLTWNGCNPKDMKCTNYRNLVVT